MKKSLKHTNLLFLVVFVFFLITSVSIAQEPQMAKPKYKLPPLQGNVQENTFHEGPSYNKGSSTGFIKDSLSGTPIPDAKIEVPDKGLSTFSRADGSFKLDIGKNEGSFIVSVKKDGYLPFALNLKKDDFSAPFTLFVERSQGQLVIDNNIHHLGDNNFSDLSANAGSFRLPAEGATFIKEFYIESFPKKGMSLIIGSTIGLDTLAAHDARQSMLQTYSSPLSIFVNSVKIAEIGLNSNNKIIPIPNKVLKPKSQNLLVLQTGVNQASNFSSQLDYDDIEFMNVILQEN